MAAALGLSRRDARFQLAVMNGTEPRASDIAAIEADLRSHRIRALLTNAQVSDPATQRLLAIARAAGIPVVGVTETEPAGADYASWMLSELNALEAALAAPT
jgi:zinc/manganese transport system substrate-binding protein